MAYEHVPFTNRFGIACFTVRPWRYDLHFHQQLEIGCVLKGQVFARVGEKSMALRPNDIFVFHENDLHSVHSEDPEARLLVFQFDPEPLLRLCGLTMSGLRLKENRIRSGEHAAYDELIGYLIRVVELQHDTGATAALRLSGVCCSLLILLRSELCEPCEGAARHADELDGRLRRILTAIEEGCAERLSLRSIADSEGVNYHYLSHFLRDRLGMSFQDYVTHTRLRRAFTMLLTTDKSFSAISGECGFSAPKYLKAALRENQDVYPFDPENVSDRSFRSRYTPAEDVFPTTRNHPDSPVSMTQREILDILRRAGGGRV